MLMGKKRARSIDEIKPVLIRIDECENKNTISWRIFISWMNFAKLPCIKEINIAYPAKTIPNSPAFAPINATITPETEIEKCSEGR